jgi:hypothetical protein
VVTPALNDCVPRLLIPVAAELAVVAPVNTQVKDATPQLSAAVGFGVTTEAAQVPAATLAVKLAEQVMVGSTVSVTVTV